MPQTVERFGRAASPGIAGGPLVSLDHGVSVRVPSGEPLRERLDLEAAVAEAIAAIRALIERSGDGDAAAILEFQVAMLEDDALIAPAFAAIAGGKDAVSAWHVAIETQIADYQNAAD